MEPIKLATSGYRSQKITMSFLKANTVSLIYPLPIVLLYLAIVFFVESLRMAGFAATDQAADAFGISDIWLSFLLYMVLLFVLIVLHELTHAFFFLRGCENGWKSIKFGIKALTPYCHCKEAVTVSVARQSCLGPLWTVALPLGVIALITGSYLLYLLTIVMIFGSGADLWVVLKLRRFNGKTCYALDMENEIGMTVFVPDENAALKDAADAPVIADASDTAVSPTIDAADTSVPSTTTDSPPSEADQ